MSGGVVACLFTKVCELSPHIRCRPTAPTIKREKRRINMGASVLIPDTERQQIYQIAYIEGQSSVIKELLK